MTSAPAQPFFATAAKGTEGALRDELRELGLIDVQATRGGVRFGGELSAAMQACFESRVAQRVLWQRGQFEAASEQALYQGVRALDLSDVLDPARSLRVSATVKHGQLRHSGFVAQKVKDALVDAQRMRWGRRSDVDRDDPDVQVFIHIARDQATLYLDLAGRPLHQRGYRRHAREAPIKETLAAAMLRLVGWNRQIPLVDPMCGSGTIAIEAAMWARNMAPGLLGRCYGFQRWALFDARRKEELRALRERADSRVLPAQGAPSVMALDIDPAAVELTRKLSREAGIALRVERVDVRDFLGTDPPGQVLTNPPYGVRLERAQHFERDLARALSQLRGHRVSAICHDPGLQRAMGRPIQEHALWNGDLECRLYTWTP